MSESAPQTDAIDWDARLKIAQTKKTELDGDLIRRQLSDSYLRQERLKTAAGLSGLVLAVAALVGGVWTAYTWTADRSRERNAKKQERIESHIADLSSERLERRLFSANLLSRYLSKDVPERNAQILSALANALAIEQTSLGRSALIMSLRALDQDVVDRVALSEALANLARHNRALRKDSPLRTGLGSIDPFDTREPKIELLNDLAEAMSVLMQKGGRVSDLNGIYFARQNLTGLSLPGTLFDGAILVHTRFEEATLRQASFAGADLAGASFIKADLRGASFRSGSLWGMHYVAKSKGKDLGGGVRIMLEMPNFRCSDLRDSDFTGHSTFGFISQKTASSFGYYRSGLQFAGADLEGANFQSTEPHAILPAGETSLPFAGCCGGYGSEITKGLFQTFYTMDSKAPLGKELEKFDLTAKELSIAFKNTNWSKAKLPTWLSEYLAKAKVTQDQDRSDNVCLSVEH
jgi:uncharacterized protein YjbI with pentapeptide repeats